jgi:chitinase
VQQQTSVQQRRLRAPRLTLAAVAAGLMAVAGLTAFGTPAQASRAVPSGPAAHAARGVLASRGARAGAAGRAIAAGRADAARSAGAASAAGRGHDGGRGGFRRVGYFLQWSIYGLNFHVSDLVSSGAAARLTQVDYAFANVSPQGQCYETAQAGQGDPWADYQAPFSASQTVDGVADTSTQPLAGNFNQLRELKARYPHLKIVMSIGGWTWSQFMSDAALTPASRRAFVASCIDLYIKGNLPVLAGSAQGGPGSAAGIFDGFDIDWEWPGFPANTGTVYRPQDKRDYVALLAEFRRQLDALGRQTHKHYVLSAFLPANPAAIQAGFDVPRVFRYLDFGDVQGYDFHVATEPVTAFQSNLFSDPADPTGTRYSVDMAIREYLSAGAPARKLVVGVPAYGRGWTGVAPGPSGDGVFQAATGQAMGTFGPGVTNYNALATMPGQRFYDRRAGATWLYDGTDWWSYDTPALLAQKAAYIRRLGLGGTAMWSLDGDDAQGSLTAAISSVLR